MTDPATSDDTAPPPPLTAEARSAFGAVADWCETQRGEADPGLGAQLLQGGAATELIAALSPDAIRFDKTAAAPTDNLAGLLQSALRRN